MTLKIRVPVSCKVVPSVLLGVLQPVRRAADKTAREETAAKVDKSFLLIFMLITPLGFSMAFVCLTLIGYGRPLFENGVAVEIF